MIRLVRTTLLGGVIFLIPVVILLIVGREAVGLIRVVSDPFVALFPEGLAEHEIVAFLVALLILVALCFLAGLVSLTPQARWLVDLLEGRVLTQLPMYSVVRARLSAMVSTDEAEQMKAVLVRFDDLWQLAVEVERVEGGMVAVFLPGAPDPWSGSIVLVEANRVSAVDLSIPVVAKLAYRMGRGTREAVGDRFIEGAAP